MDHRPEILLIAFLVAAPPSLAAPPDATNPAGIDWVWIPGGSFQMGSGDWGNAKPVHAVTVQGFWMAKTEVTWAQYGRCVEAGACTQAHVDDGRCYVWNGRTWKRGTLQASLRGDDQPAVCVDWDQATTFSAWARGRLPSEAEWEYAARGAGRDVEYPWGDEAPTCDRAVMDDGCGRDATWPVCSKVSGNTEQGLCDMAGNAWEWVEDAWHRGYSGAPTDGTAWEGGSDRVYRGGSWWDGGSKTRTALRGRGIRGRLYGYRGFRPARAVTP